MNKTLFIILIVLMSLALLGIIFVQGYWISNALKTSESEFNYSVRQALISVAEEIENQELGHYYRIYNQIADQQGEPDKATFRELVYTNTDDVRHETFVYASALLEEDYKLSSHFFDVDADSIVFRRLTNRKFVGTYAEGLDQTIPMTVGTSTTERLKEPEQHNLREEIRNIVANKPVHQRIAVTDLKRVMEYQLGLRDLEPAFEFAIFSDGLATKVTSEDFDFTDARQGTYYTHPIFSNSLDNAPKYELVVLFGQRNKYVFSTVLGMAFLSLLLTAIIVVAYISAIMQLIRQRQISEIKTDFINNMTHEFKTPLATINLALDALKNPKVTGDEEAKARYLKMIRDENKRMHAQVENILRISKLEKRDLDIRKERVKLHDLIEDTISHVSLLVENRGGYVQTHFAALKSSVLANDTHFTSVLVNILDNAIKYSEGAPKIDIYTENVKDSILVKIRDQGIGMGKAAQKKIFQKFYREPTGNIHNVKGHGLGLSYVKRIVDDHQGMVYVESEKGKGSTFIIKLQLIP